MTTQTRYDLKALFLLVLLGGAGLNANNGVLRSSDGTTLSVPVTEPFEGTTLQGDGWSATLNSGWVVRPAARPGSFTIVREN